jgi:hypothetical protein
MIPNTWSALAVRLKANGWDDKRLADARVAWEIGYYAALLQLGQTTTPESMAKVWHEYYDAAEADAKDALKRSKRGTA